jgi:hypothetical protein
MGIFNLQGLRAPDSPKKIKYADIIFIFCSNFFKGLTKSISTKM